MILGMIIHKAEALRGKERRKFLKLYNRVRGNYDRIYLDASERATLLEEYDWSHRDMKSYLCGELDEYGSYKREEDWGKEDDK